MYEDILNFWFNELTPAQWWAKDEKLDAEIKHRFSAIHTQATRCELFDWRMAAKGRLAEIIILDQFSRNIFRATPQAFANDSLALALAQEALAVEADKALSPTERSFLYMPFMHSESAEIHKVAVTLFSAPGMENNLDFELRHQTIINRFGRYPHRNKILGRDPRRRKLSF